MIEGKNKIKQKLFKYFKNPKEVISFFLPIIIAITLIIPVPYYIKMGGGTIKIDDKIKINNSYETKGSLEALYVREGKGIVLTYLLSYIIPTFEKEKAEDVTLENENEEDYNYREKLYFTSSLDAATKVAFEKAGKEVKVSSSKFIVIYIDKIANTSLKVGDEIVKVEGKEISTYDEIASIIENKKENDKIEIIVKRNKKEIKTTSKITKIDNEKKLGIILSNEIKYKSNPKVEFNFGDKQAGPSGGLMMSLSIYNKLIKEDITKGKKIVGTGTIDTLGNVGEIGGIKHKLYGANKKDADIVIVPYENYEEANKVKEKEGYDFMLIKVKTFDEAIEKLSKIN